MPLILGPVSDRAAWPGRRVFPQGSDKCPGLVHGSTVSLAVRSKVIPQSADKWTGKMDKIGGSLRRRDGAPTWHATPVLAGQRPASTRIGQQKCCVSDCQRTACGSRSTPRACRRQARHLELGQLYTIPCDLSIDLLEQKVSARAGIVFGQQISKSPKTPRRPPPGSPCPPGEAAHVWHCRLQVEHPCSLFDCSAPHDADRNSYYRRHLRQGRLSPSIRDMLYTVRGEFGGLLPRQRLSRPYSRLARIPNQDC
jgi:hypothetical protein